MRWTTAWTAAIVMAWGAGQAFGESVKACEARAPAHIRVVDCQVATAFERALERSPSLRTLVDRIGELKGIVYVTAPVNVTAKTTLTGGLFHQVVSAGETRILRIALAHESRYSDHSMAILGHELRHALEVLETPDARTEADVDALYGRIGYVRGGGIVETDPAVAMGHQVEQELIAARRGSKEN
jgi:hypothetical protein